MSPTMGKERRLKVSVSILPRTFITNLLHTYSAYFPSLAALVYLVWSNMQLIGLAGKGPNQYPNEPTCDWGASPH